MNIDPHINTFWSYKSETDQINMQKMPGQAAKLEHLGTKRPELQKDKVTSTYCKILLQQNKPQKIVLLTTVVNLKTKYYFLSL